MADMVLTITLRKDVVDAAEGQILFDIVKQRMNDHPEVNVKGHVSNHFNDEE